MAAPGRETVVRLREQGPRGRHGARAREDELVIERCHVIPRTSSEDTDRQNTVIVGMTLVAPGGTDLLATDRVQHGNDVYEIEGMPGDYKKNGRSVAVIAALARVEG